MPFRPANLGRAQRPKLQDALRSFLAFGLLISVLAASARTQDKMPDANAPTTKQPGKEELNVNWLYGAYVPKDAPLVPLTNHQRGKLFLRQTFTTPGIYFKTAFLALMDQAKGTPYEWGGGFEGYGRRLASRYGQFTIQNVFSAVGNAALQFEPRYDRCHCVGLGPRTKHAFLRNFVTYNKTEKEMRPQFALYGAAFAAGIVSSQWKPQPRPWTDGYRGMLTQAGFGMLSNWIGEFAPEISRKVRLGKLN